MEDWDRLKILRTVRERWETAVPDPIPPRKYECWMTTELKTYAEGELDLPHTREGYLEWIGRHDRQEPEPELPPGYADAMETYDKWRHGEMAGASLTKFCNAWEPLKSLAPALDKSMDELTEPIGFAYDLLQKRHDRLDAERKAALRAAAGVADEPAAGDTSATTPVPIRACQGAGGRPRKPEDPPGEGFPSWQAVADGLRIEREFGERMAEVTDAKTALLEAFADGLYARALPQIGELAETILPEVGARTDPAAASEATAYVLWPDLSITMEKGGDLFGTRTRFSCASPLFPSAVFDFEPAVMSLEDASAVRQMGVLWLREALVES